MMFHSRSSWEESQTFSKLTSFNDLVPNSVLELNLNQNIVSCKCSLQTVRA